VRDEAGVANSRKKVFGWSLSCATPSCERWMAEAGHLETHRPQPMQASAAMTGEGEVGGH